MNDNGVVKRKQLKKKLWRPAADITFSEPRKTIVQHLVMRSFFNMC